jgi:hypothetical protein
MFSRFSFFSHPSRRGGTSRRGGRTAAPLSLPYTSEPLNWVPILGETAVSVGSPLKICAVYPAACSENAAGSYVWTPGIIYR